MPCMNSKEKKQWQRAREHEREHEEARSEGTGTRESTQMRPCSRLDNQCDYALLAQIYHVNLLLLSQIEIARCLITCACLASFSDLHM